ncbi:MAG: FtsQ-type POTRA domain-containing protein [Phenylobacterium sp.]|uniref:cell division protein FtsQ/DivIB n=1 Tax=Phenylobacterium sp. TaxID=1871053 RepID=UPI0025ED1543|nr:FtsQ-type POTRA domain-containing protein [Phenylobacterium sp.]MBI1198369.1 FtsQ-type POTRA domain-containing protein [Phenylobacterium sp.]
MPAAVRGGSRGEAKPRAKASASPARRAAAKGGDARRTLKPTQVLSIAAGVLALALVVVLATGGRAGRLAGAVGHAVDMRLADAGFRLKTVHIQGASELASPDIMKAAAIYKDQPLLGVDLDELRRRVEAVGWVREAQVVRLMPDTLVIAVQERRQLAVWQHDGRTVVIDDHGLTIPEANPARFATLPLVVGAGGDKHAAEILPVLAQRPKLMARLEALVRVDDRRWDLRLKDGSLIQLPAVEQEQALMQLEQLDLRSRILELGFERIDLRNPDMVAVRPRPTVAAAAPAATPAEGA